jgi:hypothetical protein
MIFFNSSSDFSLSCAEVRAISDSFFKSPASLAIAAAVSRRSPVIITT